jgi:16S rRNA processing protein RimM
MAGSGYVIVGRVKRAHGIKGELVVEPLTDAPDVIFASGRRVFAGDARGDAGDEPAALHVSAVRPFGANILAFVNEISDRTEAELWRGRYLFLPEDEIEQPAEGEVFVHELPGMKVVSSDEGRREYGEVSHTYELPQGLLLEVVQTNGAKALLPFRAEMIVNVDRAARVISVTVPEGLFE